VTLPTKRDLLQGAAALAVTGGIVRASAARAAPSS